MICVNKKVKLSVSVSASSNLTGDWFPKFPKFEWGGHLKASDNLQLTYGWSFWTGTCRTSAARSCAARRRAAKVACKRVQLRRASSWYLWKLNESWTKKTHRNRTKPCVCVFFLGISKTASWFFFRTIRNLQGNLYGLIWDVWMVSWCLPSSLSSLKSQEFVRMAWFLDLLRRQGTPSDFHVSIGYRHKKKLTVQSLDGKTSERLWRGAVFFCFGEGFRSFYQSQI